MTKPSTQPTRVAVVGAGNVGATFASLLLFSGLAGEIVLIDANQAKAEGEAMDLNHAMPFTYPTRVWAGDYADCAGAAVTVITAGAARKAGESRLDLVKKNTAIFQDIIPPIVRHNPDGIIAITSNPVDVQTYVTWKLSGLPPHKVIGSGCILDTARFRYLLSQYFEVDPRSMHAYIIGEHGDSEVPVWSLANIAGMKLRAFCAAQGREYDQAAMDDIFRQTRDAGRDIISRKGATFYGVAAGLVRLVEAIVRNQNTVLSVSSLIHGYMGISDVALSLPTIVNQNGVGLVLPLDLSPDEVDALRRSADVLKEIIAQLNLK